MQKARAPLGKVEHRSLRRLLVTNELPEAPLGNYVVLEFETRFSARPEPMIELVTPALVGANGKLLPPVGSEGAGAEAAALARWQVCGYYVRSLEPVEMLAAPQAELLPEAQNPRQAEQQTVPQR